MRIDVHAHYRTDNYLDSLVELGKTDTDTQRGVGAGGGAELEARFRLMDRAGVEIQVLSASPQLPQGKDREKAAAAAQFVNDQYAELVERHPDRFRAFAALIVLGARRPHVLGRLFHPDVRPYLARHSGAHLHIAGPGPPFTLLA